MHRISLTLTAPLIFAATLAQAEPKHGVSMYGDLKYGPDFEHYEYVNPNAPKGGRVRMGAIGTFDTLNPFVIKGTPAAGMSLLYESLLTGSMDEPFSRYASIAQKVEMPDDRSWVEFTLDPAAKWHDGRQITVEDVIFTLQILRKVGRPIYRHYYADVSDGVRTGPNKVKFTFTGGTNPELPLIVSELMVLPKHYWQDREFDAVSLDVPIGSGPYRVKEVQPGRRIAFERITDHWTDNIPAHRGQNNFGILQFEYYRDATVAFEAFKSGAIDFRNENIAKRWASEYIFPAAKKGRVKLEMLPHENTSGMQGYVFNLRRPQFQDRKVREALTYAFDFEWSNKNLFFGQYTRSNSYFANSELASRDLPSAEELILLEPLRGKIPDEVFTDTYAAPTTDKTGIRGNLRTARKLLAEAGWNTKDGRLVNAKGEPFEFEILYVQPSSERVAAPMVANLKRLGITAKLRLVDTSQYINRLRAYDYDMVTSGFGQSNSPGNEQRIYWGSAAADQPGSRNYIGIKSQAIDQLIEHVIRAGNRKELVMATRALDRVLLWGHYVIPQYHLAADRIAYWDRFARPAIKPRYSVGFTNTWWIDPAKDAIIGKTVKKP